jgi:hypothetical protein
MYVLGMGVGNYARVRQLHESALFLQASIVASGRMEYAGQRVNRLTRKE